MINYERLDLFMFHIASGRWFVLVSYTSWYLLYIKMKGSNQSVKLELRVVQKDENYWLLYM